jgi:hypothetical protein
VTETDLLAELAGDVLYVDRLSIAEAIDIFIGDRQGAFQDDFVALRDRLQSDYYLSRFEVRVELVRLWSLSAGPDDSEPRPWRETEEWPAPLPKMDAPEFLDWLKWIHKEAATITPKRFGFELDVADARVCDSYYPSLDYLQSLAQNAKTRGELRNGIRSAIWDFASEQEFEINLPREDDDDNPWRHVSKNASGKNPEAFLKEQRCGIKPTGQPKPAEPRRIGAPELLGKTFAEPKWAAKGLIPEGLTILAGPPKLGKSWFVLQLALSVTGGERAFDAFDCQAGKALYMALEDPQRRMKSRLLKLRSRWPNMETRGLEIQTQADRISDGLEDDIRKWLTENPGARLVIVDTLAKVRPARKRGGDIYAEDYAVVAALKAVADEFAVAIVAVTHTRKAKDDDKFAMITGTSAISGAADTMIVLDRARGQSNAILHVTGRDVEESETAMEWSKETARWISCGDATKFRLTQEAAEIYEVIEKAGRPISTSEVYDALPGRKKDNIKYHLKQLIDNGQIVAKRKGLYHLPGAELSLVGAEEASSKWAS